MTQTADIVARARIPRTVWMLGLTSLCMDLSSETVHSLLPLLLVTNLGASAFMLGLIDGLAEATASVTKIVSGALSDRWGRRKALALAGYGLSALSKPLFPLAASAGAVFAARLFDRFGKGIRGAPRDALVADATPPPIWGAAYGLRQGLDTVGALAGPLAATGLMLLFAGEVRTVLWFACLPAVLAVAVLALGVREPARAAAAVPPAFPLRRAEIRRLPRAFWAAMAGLFLLLLPRFSEAFLLLRGQADGLAPACVPLVLAAMNLVAAATSWPAGRWSDRRGRTGLLAGGFALLVLADLVLALAAAPAVVFLGAVLWGLHLGLTQGVLAALVADAAPADLRGTAFGIFHLVSGAAVLAGSLAAGALWDAAGPAVPFAAAAATGSLALIALPAFGLRRKGSAPA